MMTGRGAGGIKFGKVEVFSSTETLDEMKKQLIDILEKIGYPEIEGDDERGIPGLDEEDEEESVDELAMKEDDEALVEDVVKKQPWTKKRVVKNAGE